MPDPSNKNVPLVSLCSLSHSDAPYHAYVISERTESLPLHCHDFYQICFVAQGNICHRYPSGIIPLYINEAFIIPPGFIHSVVFDDPKALVYSLYFQESMFIRPSAPFSDASKFLTALKLNKSSEDQQSIKLKVRMDMSRSTTFRALMECLLRDIQQDEHGPFSATFDLIDAMLLIIAQSYFAQPHGRKQLNKLDENHEIIQRCITYIDQNYNQELSVAHITHRFAISRTTFNLLFPTIAGQPFKQYLIHKRIQRALQLMNLGNLQLVQIAQMVGYADFSTFYRNFTRIVGASPSQYRSDTYESQRMP